MPNSDPQDIYARHLLSRRGYPLWMPEPSHQLLVYRREGLKIGDVGVVIPEDGSFDVFFNICLPKSHPFHQATGVPDNFEPIELDAMDIRTAVNAENPDRILASSSVKTVRIGRSGVHRRTSPVGLDYEFNVSSGEGALLILPEGAERHDLRDHHRFLEMATQRGADWYRFVEERVGQIIGHDSLYLITGLHKTRSYSLAAFERTAGTAEYHAQFRLCQDQDDITATYSWDTTRTMDWRAGPLQGYEMPNQAVFIRGFKIALRAGMFGTRWITVKADSPSTRINPARSSGTVPGDSWLGYLFSGMSSSRAFESSRDGPQLEGEIASDPALQAARSEIQNNGALAVGEDVVIQRISEASQAFHPSDIINRYLLNKNPSAYLSITHDDDWIAMLEANLIQPEELSHENRLETLVTQRYDMISEEGAVYLQRRSGSTLHKEQSDLGPETFPDKPDYLNNLAVSYKTRFDRFKRLSDLEEAISKYKDAIDAAPQGHPGRPAYLNNLAISHKVRFDHLGQISDLENMILRSKDAISLASESHPGKPSFMNNLGVSYKARFDRLGQIDDLRDAISRYRDAITLAPEGHPGKPCYLNNLAISYKACFDRVGQLADLEEAISLSQRAVLLAPDGHPNKPNFLNNLVINSKARFDHLGQHSLDLENLILRSREAISLAPDDHPGKPSFLNNLAIFYKARFDRLGQIKDLEDAISRYKDAINLTPEGHPGKPSFLNNLSLSYQARFNRLGQIADLEDAISRSTDAISLTPNEHPSKPTYLDNLSASYKARFDCLRQLADLNAAISGSKDAINLAPQDHSSKPSYLNRLAYSLRARSRYLGDLKDLDEAVSMSERAIVLIPTTHPDRPSYLNNLALSFTARFEWVGKLSDLKQVTLILGDAIDLLPEGHPDEPTYRNQLDEALETLYSLSAGRHDDDLEYSAMEDLAVDSQLEHLPRMTVNY